MYLELAEGNKEGYTWLPYDDNTTEGAYVRTDVLKEVLGKKNILLSGGFFSSLWSGIKDVAMTGIRTITGANQQPVIVQAPPPTDNSKFMLLGLGAIAILFLLKK